jgi:hypothetical protein
MVKSIEKNWLKILIVIIVSVVGFYGLSYFLFGGKETVVVLLGQTSAIATIITAWVAFKIYRQAKNDEIEYAARIIILEIRESEKTVKRLTEFKNANPDPHSVGYPNDLVKIIPLKGWEKYSHLFIKRMNNDEYDQISDYYNKCEILEKYLEKNYNFYWITTEERAKQKEALGAKLAYDKPDISPEDFRREIEKIGDHYSSNTLGYLPAGIRQQIDRNLNSINLITLTPTWNKLKNIAKYNDLLG